MFTKVSNNLSSNAHSYPLHDLRTVLPDNFKGLALNDKVVDSTQGRVKVLLVGRGTQTLHVTPIWLCTTKQR